MQVGSLVQDLNRHKRRRFLNSLSVGVSSQVAARRTALYSLLAEGRPIIRERIWQQLSATLGAHCLGKHPQGRLRRNLLLLSMWLILDACVIELVNIVNV